MEGCGGGCWEGLARPHPLRSGKAVRDPPSSLGHPSSSADALFESCSRGSCNALGSYRIGETVLVKKESLGRGTLGD